MDPNKVIEVVNRENIRVVFRLKDSFRSVQLNPGEKTKMTFEELEKLRYLDGGLYMIKHNLLIKDKEAIEELLGNVEPEYFYTKAEVKKLLSEGTVEELQDALDFAPKGVISLIQDTAIEMKIDSLEKRNAITKATKLDISSAIEINEETKEEAEEVEAASKTRRVAPAKPATTSTGRRAAAPVVSEATEIKE